MNPNLRKDLFAAVVFFASLVLGYFLAVGWAAWTGNLMMGQDEYERRGPSIRTTMLLIQGGTAIIGALIGFVIVFRRNRN